MMKLVQQVFTLLCTSSFFIQTIACSTIINTTVQESSRHSLNPIVYTEEGTTLKELVTFNPISSEEDFKCSCTTLQDCSNCEDNEEDDSHAMLILTVSEIFLATAIIMGLTAVVTIMLRFCTRPVQDYNQNATTIIPRGGIRVSLTSLQQRVMRKLRDRPPRYETRHNYEYNQRENPIAVITMEPKSSNEPPPPYDNELVTTNEQPPSYIMSDLENNSNINLTEQYNETTNQLANRHNANNILHI